VKKGHKILSVVLCAVLIVFLVVAAALYFFAETALKIGVEAAATKALNVGVSIGQVELSIFGSTVIFEDIIVKNPPGYQHENLLELQNTEIQLDTGSLLADVVEVRKIKLDGITLTFEQRGISGNNLQDVIKNIPAKKQDDQPVKSGKKLHIDELEMTNITVMAKPLPVPGKKDTIKIQLSGIRMTNLGTDRKLDTSQLTAKVLLALSGAIATQGAGKLPTDMLKPLVSSLKKFKELPDILLKQGDQVLRKGKGLGEEAIKQGRDIGEEITKGLGGLLKKGKEEDKQK